MPFASGAIGDVGNGVPHCGGCAKKLSNIGSHHLDGNIDRASKHRPFNTGWVECTPEAKALGFRFFYLAKWVLGWRVGLRGLSCGF